MKAHARQCWNRKRLRGRAIGLEVPHVAQRMESGLQLRCLVPWTASIHRGRCRGLMDRVEFLTLQKGVSHGRGIERGHDGFTNV